MTRTVTPKKRMPKTNDNRAANRRKAIGGARPPKLVKARAPRVPAAIDRRPARLRSWLLARRYLPNASVGLGGRSTFWKQSEVPRPRARSLPCPLREPERAPSDWLASRKIFAARLSQSRSLTRGRQTDGIGRAALRELDRGHPRRRFGQRDGARHRPRQAGHRWRLATRSPPASHVHRQRVPVAGTLANGLQKVGVDAPGGSVRQVVGMGVHQRHAALLLDEVHFLQPDPRRRLAQAG